KGPEYISMAKKGGLANVVIVKADKEENNHLGLILQKELAKAWRVDIPLVDWDEARNGDKNIILFGKAKNNMALRELDANNLLGNNDKGYEIRTIPNALSWKKDVIYINGTSESDFKQAINILLKKATNPDKIKFFIECKGWTQENVQKDHQDFIK